MTPLYCPHCRRPVDGDLEHGVCPTGWVREPADKPLVEVAPHVWRYTEAKVEEKGIWRVYRGSSREEDFGEPLTPRRLAWSLWKWRLAAAGVGAMFAILMLVAANAI